ncbi:MAG: 30S ribosomal protein S12 methylthiotransferase RimO [Clostridia bacterium]|nr:30S ribosomal protein S12 methylthiotransferase RimO [Clostridia bacterium]
MNVGFIHLGCSKNLVDTEMAIGLFKDNNYKVVNNEEEADIIVINTCGFINSAKEEAINTILEMVEYKKKRCKYLIVMGCLVQRYKEELAKEIPEVDLWIKYDSYSTIWEQISSVINPKNNNKKNLDFLDRTITTGDNFAYLRIAEGCDNFCTFCAIPNIRGKFTSRKIEDILEEAKKLAKEGYKELIIIAQDTTKYGVDIYGESKLPELLTKLCKIKDLKWIRFLYSYPETITDELIEVVKKEDKICKYFDIPIQHFSDAVLKRMNRKSDSKSIEKLIIKLRKEIPEVVIRTTVMVGFPGETEEDFNKLYNFIERTRFDRLGAFSYSKEEGTAAEKMPNQVHPSTKRSRYNKIMKLQNKISTELQNEMIGKELEVLIETRTFDNKYYVGRSYREVPDIDGIIYVEMVDKALEGKFVKVEITDATEYDLIGKIK